jgi:hypothetical protein
MMIAFAPIQRVENGAVLPVSVAIHQQDQNERPRQVDALADQRDFEEESGGTYTITSRHLAVYVRSIDALRQFRQDYAFHNFHIRMIRSIFIYNITIDFPTLRWMTDEFPFLQMVRFENVRFEMTSWRNIQDQVCLFHDTNPPRIVNFYNCVFLEDVGVVRVLGTVRLMANRIPVYFYRFMVIHGILTHIDRRSGKFFFILQFFPISNKFV